jgi:integrase
MTLTINDYKAIITNDERLSDVCKGYFLIMVINGLRVSEVLRLRVFEEDSRGYTYIKASKSDKRIAVNLRASGLYYCTVKEDNGLWLTYTNRFWIYRQFKRMGLVVQVRSNVNKSVTHGHRHLIADEVRSLTNDNKNVTEVLHHNSKKSQQSYGTEKK